MIENSWEFSEAELREWAYDSDKTIPDQDWDLSIACSGYDNVVLELAEDYECPNQKYMITCLYVIVGDLIHCQLGKDRKEEVEELVLQGSKSNNPEILKWVSESISVLRQPNTFDYDHWCNREV